MKAYRHLGIIIFLIVLCTACGSQPSTRDKTGSGPTDRMDEAIREYKRGDLLSAQKLLDEIMQGGLQTASVWNLQGSIFQQQDQHEAALKSFNQALALDPVFADAYNNRALSQRILGDDAAAEADFREAIRLNPDFGLAHYNLAVLLHEKYEYAQALAELQLAAQLLPQDSDIWFQLGLTADRNNQPDLAIQSFTKAIEIDQGFDDQSFYMRGIVFGEIGDFQKAELDFDRVIQMGLRNAETLFYRGLMRYYRENYQGALDDFREALRYAPQDVDTLYYLSFTCARTGDVDCARDFAQKALDMDPLVESVNESP